MVAASIGRLVADIAQMAAGRRRLLALDLPLAWRCSGTSIGLSIYASTWRPARRAARSASSAAHLALDALLIEHRS
jgi:hypothetical protein